MSYLKEEVSTRNIKSVMSQNATTNMASLPKAPRFTDQALSVNETLAV